jgi:hypothetical protein
MNVLNFFNNSGPPAFVLLLQARIQLSDEGKPL